MKKLTLFTAVIAAVTLMATLHNDAFAQTVQMNSRVLKQQNFYSEISGSPYLYNDWSKGSVTLNDGKIVENLDIRFDQLTDVISYKNERDEEMEVAEPVKEFKVKVKGVNRLFRAGYLPAGNNTATNFYEVLVDGNVQFLKRLKKDIMTTRDYNATADTKTVTEKISYYIVKNNQPVLVAKNEKAVLAAIGDKSTELTAFIKQNKLNLKNDEDISSLVEYYNKLPK